MLSCSAFVLEFLRVRYSVAHLHDELLLYVLRQKPSAHCNYATQIPSCNQELPPATGRTYLDPCRKCSSAPLAILAV